MTFALSMLLYVDRIAISTAKGPITARARADATRSSAGCCRRSRSATRCSRRPPALLADRFGPRIVLSRRSSPSGRSSPALTGLAWSFVALLVVPVPVRRRRGRRVSRRAPGPSTAGCPSPSAGSRRASTSPARGSARRSRCRPSPGSDRAIGMARVFLRAGRVGVVWARSGGSWFRDTPEEHRRRVGGRARADRRRARPVAPPSPRRRCRSPRCSRRRTCGSRWAQYFASNFTFFFCLTWLFPYLQRTYELDAFDAGFLASAPLLAGAVGNWVGGWLVDALYRRGQWRLSRQLPGHRRVLLAAGGLLGSLLFDGPIAERALPVSRDFRRGHDAAAVVGVLHRHRPRARGRRGRHDEHGGQYRVVRDEPGVPVPAGRDRIAPRRSSWSAPR